MTIHRSRKWIARNQKNKINPIKDAFLILPVWIILLTICHGQEPPKEKRDFRNPDLVELIKLDPTLRLDIRYATTNNFVGRAVYRETRAFLQRPAAEALVRANKTLRKKGYGLVIFDGYRPHRVAKIFWDFMPADKKQFVADPDKGSLHSCGCAVDLTMFDLKTGKAVKMPSEFDEWTGRSHINYQGGSKESRRLRDVLKTAMEAEGFFPAELEWWHYNYKDWEKYQVLDINFSAISDKPGNIETGLE